MTTEPENFNRTSTALGKSVDAPAEGTSQWQGETAAPSWPDEKIAAGLTRQPEGMPEATKKGRPPKNIDLNAMKRKIVDLRNRANRLMMEAEKLEIVVVKEQLRRANERIAELEDQK